MKNSIFSTNNKIDTVKLARIGIVAALYVALTLLLAPLSFGVVQLRISEVLMLLCFFRKEYIVSLTLGCFISNIFSPMAALDIPFGTLATLLAAICMWKSRHILIAAVWPILFNGVIIGIELLIAFQQPFLIAAGSVALGELLAVLVIGVPVFMLLLKNVFVSNLIGSEKMRNC